MRRAVPEPWATAMIDAGITDPRYTDPRPSMSQLAQRIGVHTSTISGLVFGERVTDQRIVDQVAEQLGVSAEAVADWVGRSVANPYQPPATASLLTRDEREHVDWIIRRLTRDRTTPAVTDERTAVEDVEGVTRLTTGELKGELRDAIRRRAELTDGRRLDPDEVQLVVVLTEKIARLEAALNPPQETGGHAQETGS